MKSLKAIPLALAMIALALPAAAQTDVDLDPEVGARISLSIDKKLRRGLHISFEEEVRFDNNFGSLDRLQHTLHASYKVHTNVKVGLGYALINGYSSTNSAFKGARHRLMGDAAYTWHLSQWNISIKERLQYTLRSGDYNTYQNPAGALGLKSRLSAKYKGWQHRGWTPYAYLELRTNFSGPSITADYNAATAPTLSRAPRISRARRAGSSTVSTAPITTACACASAPTTASPAPAPSPPTCWPTTSTRRRSMPTRRAPSSRAIPTSGG